MNPEEIEHIPLRELKMEDGAQDLAESAAMRPYIKLATAVMSDKGLKEAVDEIRALPLEERYLWRIVSALKWAFADFDTIGIVVDRKALLPEDRLKIAELIKHRPVQFCMFIKALLGEEAMEDMMTRAIAVAKQVPPGI